MIKLFDPVISDAAISSVSDVLKSGWIGQGPVTEEFEKKFAEYVGVKYAVAVNSATSALHIAIKALDLNPGDEVLTTSITFVSTNHVLLHENLTPVFCDVEEDTLNLDLEKAEALISSKTKAIMVVHYGGNPLNMDRLYSFAASHDLKVIEDAAHACGASYKGRKIGSFGLTCFSFQAVKNLPAGDGGAITTNDEELFDRLMRLRWMGIDKSTFDRTSSYRYSWNYAVEEAGYKYHMNDITASLALSGLKDLDFCNTFRHYMVTYYREHLDPDVRTLSICPDHRSSNHLFVIKSSNRNNLYRSLSDAGICAGVHYKPNHLYSIYAGFVKSPLSVTEKVYDEILSLPLHLNLSETDIDEVCAVVNALHR